MSNVVGRKVRLKCDLTRYNTNLVEGAIGTLVDPDSFRGEQFADCIFPGTAAMPILYKSLEILGLTSQEIDKLLIEAVEAAEESGLLEKASSIRAIIDCE